MASLKQALALGVYSTLMRALWPLLYLRFQRRARREPIYGEALAERYGFYTGKPPPDAERPLWLHAVSLGETRAAEPLIKALREARPELRLLLTHGTATGRETGRALLRPGDQQRWLPIDSPGAVRRFLAWHRPLAGVLMETEVWPNLQQAARAAGVPMLLANARLSPKSLRQSLRFDALLRPAAQTITKALAQTAGDAERLRQAGAPDVQVCGNLKFDMSPEPALLQRGQAWRAAAGVRPVVLAASWREGEDAPLLSAWREQLAAAQPSAVRPLLLLVPRHPQRFDEVAGLIEQAGLSLSRRSRWGAPGVDVIPDPQACAADVWLGDSMREMPAYYATADVALLGGSFAPLGGQNLIEAAACGCPVVMGPHTFNFAEAAELAEAQGAARRVATLTEGVAQALALATDAPAEQAAVEAARQYAGAHRGAAERMARAVLAAAGLSKPC
ncbi:MAG: 3-deoxy-D-manno-octulosonic acid transferase [Leptothrix sp. (in: b-proteobacteria)]